MWQIEQSECGNLFDTFICLPVSDTSSSSFILTSITSFSQRISNNRNPLLSRAQELFQKGECPKGALYFLEDHAEGAADSALLHQSRVPHPNPTFPVKPGSVKEGEPNCYTCRFGLTRFVLTEHTGWPRTPQFWSDVQVLQWWGCFEKLHEE